ncbi:MAG: restriction endonuclease subunit S [Synergistaceae bacterium]|nr:restriction endonuclease subunit S [Synergistaceae bacterium]
MSVKDFSRAKDGFIEDTIDHISEKGLEHSATNLIMPGAIIICMRMGLGKYARLKKPTAINQDLRAIWLSEDVLADYFLYFYSTLKIEGTGTTVKGIKRNELLSYLIPLPPLEEQHRIVSRLDAILPLIDELEALENELEALKKKFPGDMRDALLQAAIEGELTGGSQEGWRWVKLGEIANFYMGKTPYRSDGVYWNGNISWVTISDMQQGKIISETREKITEQALQKFFRGNITKAGTLIMSFKLTIGRCSILGIDAVHNEAIISIYPRDSSKVMKYYLLHILPYITQFGDIKTAIKGNTLNSKSLNDLLIPLPPLEEQHRIVSRLNELLPLCEDLESIEQLNDSWPDIAD